MIHDFNFAKSPIGDGFFYFHQPNERQLNEAINEIRRPDQEKSYQILADKVGGLNESLKASISESDYQSHSAIVEILKDKLDTETFKEVSPLITDAAVSSKVGTAMTAVMELLSNQMARGNIVYVDESAKVLPVLFDEWISHTQNYLVKLDNEDTIEMSDITDDHLQKFSKSHGKRYNNWRDLIPPALKIQIMKDTFLLVNDDGTLAFFLNRSQISQSEFLKVWEEMKK